ncbi:response regulator [Methylobacterium sp. Leaf118]|uniref:response regulator n=1 Tax=Methylobacterium sp. Leaf118 TaxID=2876562 RepID=UPI001E2921EF|nr:response regulator [Methylobacterium sp. Leaf118]
MSTTREKPIVLVVEDDAVTRHSAIAMIEDAGFAVWAVDNGNAAIRVLDDGAAVRVVVTDIDMPLGIDGIKLAACIHRRWPGVGIVIASGKVRPQPGDVPAEGRFLRKPYTEEQVIEAIRGLLDPSEAPPQG